MRMLRTSFLAAALVCPALAQAHFVLNEPAALSGQDAFGGPQKSAPCGLEDPGNPPNMTGAVTTYLQGQSITVALTEVIYHPGHYRVLIAPDQASLPPDPVVTAGSTPCGSAEIDPSPELPLVADGLLVHDSALVGEQTLDIQLPPQLTCTNCVLQVVEFMSNHELNNPGGCYYHHCATITIVPNVDGGTSDAGVSGEPGVGGCTCDSSPGGSQHIVVLLLLLLLARFRAGR